MEENKTHQQIRLPDGRKLGYAEFGPPEGKAVIYFHGFPSSRLDWMLFHDDTILRELNVRVIAVDRPGYGLSDFKGSRTLFDWPEDVAALGDKLALDRFVVLGISGGGPYAAVCGHKIPDRLDKVGLVSGMGPPDAPGMQDGISWTLPGHFTLIRRILLRLTAMGLERDPDRFLSQTKAAVSGPDQALLENPALAEMFIAALREALRPGVAGANLDAAIYTHPWGFKLQGIQTEVHLWHAELDLNVPISVARHIAKFIPECQESFVRKEGHFTLPRNRIREIIGNLTS